MGRLVALLGAILLLDSAFFGVLAPMLNHYVDEFGLSKTGAGLLSAAFAAGAAAGAIPGGYLATRAGSRATVVVGLTLMAGSSAAFGFATSDVTLDLARFSQGVASSCVWTGGLVWLIELAPIERRGELIGFVLSAGVGGTLLGPAIGSLSAVAGARTVFLGLAALAAIFATLSGGVRCVPPLHRRSQGLVRGLLQRKLAPAAWLMTLPAIVLGAFSVLVPLQFHQLGWGTFGVGSVFFAAAAVKTLLNPPLGRWSDRHSRLSLSAALILAIVALLIWVPWVRDPWALAVLIVASSTAAGVLWTPATALLADATDSLDVDPALGFAVANGIWAPGAIAGAAGAGALAGAGGNIAAYLALVVICAFTVAWMGASHAARVQSKPAQSLVEL